MESLLSWSDVLILAIILIVAAGASHFVTSWVRDRRIHRLERAKTAKDLAFQISQSRQILISNIKEKGNIHLHLRARSEDRNVIEFPESHPDFTRLSLLTLPATLSFRFQSKPIETMSPGNPAAYLSLRVSYSD